MKSLKDNGGTSTLTAVQVRAQADAANVAYDASTGTELAAVDTKVDTIDGIVDILLLEAEHITAVFPEDTDETVTFAAGGTNHIWSAWAEIVDNNAVTLSSKLASIEGHISSIMVEDASVKDKAYMVEIAYGAAKTIVSRQRYMAKDSKVGTTQQVRIRAAQIPAGETIYYRAKCETSGATIQVHLRYHLHP